MSARRSGLDCLSRELRKPMDGVVVPICCGTRWSLGWSVHDSVLSASDDQLPLQKRREHVTSTLDRKGQILASSAALFSLKGVGATTVREIGEAAGVFSGSLYHYFKSKNAIVAELLTIFMSDIETRFDLIETTASTSEELIRGLIRETLTVIDLHPHETSIYQNDQNYLRDQGLLESVDNASRDFRERWLRAIREGANQEIFRKDIEPELFYGMVRNTLWSTNQWPDRGKYSLTEMSELLTALFFDGFRTEGAGPASEAVGPAG